MENKMTLMVKLTRPNGSRTIYRNVFNIMIWPHTDPETQAYVLIKKPDDHGDFGSIFIWEQPKSITIEQEI